MKTKIVYEDDRILVCYKPPGLATQTARVGQQDMVSELKNYLARANAGHGAPYLGIVHRLDQPVEGLLVFAKDKKVAASLTAQLSQGTLNKQYYAVVCGKPASPSGELVDYLWKDAQTGSAIVRNPKHVPEMAGEVQGNTGEVPKKAVLQYRVIEEISTPDPVALLDIHIDTGRFHQIRAQLSHAGWPILGDGRYGSVQSKELSARLGVRNVALCAYRILLKHPGNGQIMEFEKNPSGHIFHHFTTAGFDRERE